MQKIYYYFEGGLGDVIIQYYGNRHLALLEEHKRRHGGYVRVILNVHNSESAELFRAFGAVDEIRTLAYQPKDRAGIHAAARLEGFVPAKDQIPASDQPPVIRLTPADAEYLSGRLPRGPLILFHPGSGKKHFRLFGRLDLSMLAGAAERAGVTVAMVGGTSLRTIDGAESQRIEETSDVRHPALLNLLGSANPRLVCEIARRADGFVGTLSCYAWAAAFHAKPGVVFIPDGFHDDYVDRAIRMGMSVVPFQRISGDPSFYDELVAKSLSAVPGVPPAGAGAAGPR